jgi:hypothetical protein
MGKVLMEITMSLDGYTTGPDVSAEEPLGRGGERLHEWMFAGKSAVEGGADIDRQYLNAGLIDEIRLHVAPIVLGGGTPLFTGVRPDGRSVDLVGQVRGKRAVGRLARDQPQVRA